MEPSVRSEHEIAGEASQGEPAKRRKRRRNAAQEGPEPVDVHVGARIRLRRTLLGLSQGELGRQLDLTFQQIQKYERGVNRVSASILHKMAGILSVPVSFFFDDLADNLKLPPTAGDKDPIMQRESLDLLRHYYGMPESVRRQIYDLVKSLGRKDDEDED